MKLKLVNLFSIVLLAFVAVQAQQPAKTPDAANVKTFQPESKLMKRQMPYRIVLPVDYDKDKTARFPVIYMLHGLGGNYTNLSEGKTLRDLYAQYRFIIVTPDGGSGFYTDSATKPDDRYESYLIQELIPEIDKNFRTVADRKGRAVAGLSMGGYGALKFGAKYPQMFALAASMSGAVSSAEWRKPEDLPQIPYLRQLFLSIYGDGSNPTLAANDLFKIFGDTPADKAATLPFFYLDCGTEDDFGLLEPNRRIAAVMSQHKIAHEFRELPGRHNAAYWAQQIPEIMRVADKIFTVQK